MKTKINWQSRIAPVMLGMVLVQILMFFFGLIVPLNRILLEYNKTVGERLALIEPRGAFIKNVAEQLPKVARVYLLHPEPVTHKFSIYYFYPRIVSISMMNANYEGGYERWDERPSMAWLQTNQFDFVLSYKDRTLVAVQPAHSGVYSND